MNLYVSTKKSMEILKYQAKMLRLQEKSWVTGVIIFGEGIVWEKCLRQELNEWKR